MQPGFRNSTVVILLAISAMLPGCCCITGYFGYQQKNGKWVYVSMAGETPVDADETLKTLSDSQYAKDRTKVFYCGRELKRADSDTFELDSVNRGVRYAHDQHRVYFDGKEIRDADPATFEVIDWYYSRDVRRVYCGTVPMNVAHPDDIEVVMASSLLREPRTQEGIERIYGKEFADWPVDEYRFMVSACWTRDGEFWYWGPSRVEGADYASFKPIDQSVAEDKHGRFRGLIPEEVWAENMQKHPQDSIATEKSKE